MNMIYNTYVLPAAIGCIMEMVLPNPLNADLKMVVEPNAMVARSLGDALSPIPHANVLMPYLRRRFAGAVTSSADCPCVRT